MKFFDMKLIFLITALCSETRLQLKNDQQAVVVLMEILELVLKEAADSLPLTINDDQPPQINLNVIIVDLKARQLFSSICYGRINKSI